MFELFLSLFSNTALMGVLAGVLSTCAFIPYIRDTLAGRTHPLRSSWLIWSVLVTISFFSQMAEGAGASLWLAGAQAFGTITVMLLSIRRGMGRYLSGADGLVLGAATVGLGLWAITDNAVYALMIAITMSLLGGLVTVRKAYLVCRSETLAKWALSFTASICAMLAVGTLDWVLLAYPLYLFVLNGAIVVAMLTGTPRYPEVVFRSSRIPQPLTVVHSSAGHTRPAQFPQESAQPLPIPAE